MEKVEVCNTVNNTSNNNNNSNSNENGAENVSNKIPNDSVQTPTKVSFNEMGTEEMMEKKRIEDYSKWKIVYPNYLNKEKKIREGRRVNVKYCVNNPTIHNIASACRDLGIKCVVENEKCYPKDWQVKGRVRVKVPIEFLNINNKFGLLKALGLKMQEMNVNNSSPSQFVGHTHDTNDNTHATKKKKKKQKEKERERERERDRSDKHTHNNIGNVNS